MTDVYTFTGHGTCRSCQAAILWFRTPNGRAIPVDDGVEGLPMLERGDTFERGSPEAKAILGATHFSTCQHADQHRRRR